MPRSPVLAKLTRPRTHQAVARERLFALLDRARDCPLVWIDSPPGSGKTTLVASYLQDRGGREVWYQVDTGDGDPAAFFHYLSSTVEARGNPRLPQLAPEHLNDLQAFARRFFRQFFTRVPVLVLDNFQEAAEPLLTELLRHAVEEVPPQRSLIVISRSAPPANFAELEVRAQLFRIDWSEVKLTLEETRAMSARRGIAEDWIVQSLHRQASGWAAGVTLMLERFKHAGSGAGELSGETFRLRPPSPDIERWPWPLRIRTLGDFEVRLDEHPLEVGRKTPRRVLALLKSLVALGPREVPEQQLVDALWPDEEGDAAHKSLSITVLRLRRLLGDNDLIRQCGGKLSIDPQRSWVDAWAFERRLGASDASTMEKTLALYRGSFLPDDVDAPFTVPTRERLRAKFVHALGELGRQLEAHQRYEEAIGWYLRGLEADPIIETFYQGLMRCYVALDRRTEAIAAYRRLKQTLSVTLGLAPSTTTERLHLTVRGG